MVYIYIYYAYIYVFYMCICIYVYLFIYICIDLSISFSLYISLSLYRHSLYGVLLPSRSLPGIYLRLQSCDWGFRVLFVVFSVLGEGDSERVLGFGFRVSGSARTRTRTTTTAWTRTGTWQRKEGCKKMGTRQEKARGTGRLRQRGGPYMDSRAKPGPRRGHGGHRRGRGGGPGGGCRTTGCQQEGRGGLCKLPQERGPASTKCH